MTCDNTSFVRDRAQTMGPKAQRALTTSVFPDPNLKIGETCISLTTLCTK